ncbi:hypothetical protein BCR44DRAFT_1482173 [Catenaria anguillulae PL171]|uniref:Adenylate cyclase n=1 Tax=Catenaria anguillulae PL171 TaxID=765915 RepID=A0A1Y2I4J1_9FUNG|nr:hypothetical protein BCR44DRAFT_1482173 [Catenaria anguillulae PL171]
MSSTPPQQARSDQDGRHLHVSIPKADPKARTRGISLGKASDDASRAWQSSSPAGLATGSTKTAVPGATPDSPFDEFASTEKIQSSPTRSSFSGRLMHALSVSDKEKPTNSSNDATDSRDRKVLANLVPALFRKALNTEESKRSKSEEEMQAVGNASPKTSARKFGVHAQSSGKQPSKTDLATTTSTDPKLASPAPLSSPSPVSALSSASPSTPSSGDKRVSVRIYRQDGTYSTIACPPRATSRDILEQLARRFFIDNVNASSLYLRILCVDLLLESDAHPLPTIAGWLHAAGYPYEYSHWSSDRWREEVSFLCRVVCAPSPSPPSPTSASDDPIWTGPDKHTVDLRNRNLRAIPAAVFNNTSLLLLDLSGNWNLALPPTVFYLRARNLAELRLSDLNLSAIPDSLRHATNLMHLDLSSNRISDFKTSMFEPLASLATLSLRGNHIAQLPTSLEALARLNTLNLACNRLTNVSRTLSHLLELSSQLLEIDVRWNKLTDLSMVHPLPNLCEINAHGNMLTGSVLPPPKATRLYLSKNPLTSFAPMDISHEYLTILNLTSCQLTSVPVATSKLKNLERLILDNNQLTHIAVGLSAFPQLQVFRAARNSLQVFPHGIEENTKLQVLDLHDNNISEVPPAIWDCSALTSLNLASNLLTWLPVPTPSSLASEGGVPMLSRFLMHLSLCDNRLEDNGTWPALGHLSELAVLNISCNRLTELPEDIFDQWRRMEVFVASNNTFGTIPASIGTAKHLRVLCLNGNRLISVATEVVKLQRLEVLDLGCNQLKFNIHNHGYDWNWSWNRELRYLNLSGNRRLEIKADKNQHGPEADPSTFKMLPKLRVLGLSDVALRSAVPEDTEYRRVRTALGEAGMAQFGVAEFVPIGTQRGACRDCVVTRPRGFQGQDENLFVLVDSHMEPNSGGQVTLSDPLIVRRMLKIVAEGINKHMLSHMNRSQDIPSALRLAFLETNHQLALAFPPKPQRGAMTASSPLARVGCSAAVAFIHGTMLHVTNVGDAVTLSAMHSLTNVKERDRVLGRASAMTASSSATGMAGAKLSATTPIVSSPLQQGSMGSPGSASTTVTPTLLAAHSPTLEELGGPNAVFISETGALNGCTTLTRQFGCFALASVVNTIPHYTSVQLAEGDEFVLLLSKSILEYIAPQVAVDIVRQDRSDMGTAAERLRDVVASYCIASADDGTSGADRASVGMIMTIGVEALVRDATRRRANTSNSNIHLLPARSVPLRKAVAPQANVAHDRMLNRLDKEPDPPVGHVALVFTDVQSSTKLWETFPSAMQAAIKLHHQLLRRLLRNPGRGYEVKTEGDAFMVAFPTVFHAARWCLAVQEQLLTVEWPQELLAAEDAKEVFLNGSLDGGVIFRGIRVRMGIHCGSPVCERDPVTGRMDYYGRSSACGGEITFSLDVLNEFEEYQAIGLDGVMEPTIPESESAVSNLGNVSDDESAIPASVTASSTSVDGSIIADPTKMAAANQLRRLKPAIKKLGTCRFDILHSSSADATKKTTTTASKDNISATLEESGELARTPSSLRRKQANLNESILTPTSLESARTPSATTLDPISVPAAPTDMAASATLDELRDTLSDLSRIIQRLEHAAAGEPITATDTEQSLSSVPHRLQQAGVMLEPFGRLSDHSLFALKMSSTDYNCNRVQFLKT